LNKMKYLYYFSQAAIIGNHHARHNLGCFESLNCNLERAMKHFRIAAKNGVKESLESLRTKVVEGVIEQSEFDSILEDYETSVNEEMNEERDLAAALLAKSKRGQEIPMLLRKK
jgi:TPR repeat protein